MIPTVQLSKTALFLDVDGTLVPLAPTPEEVYFSSELLELLAALYAATDQAVCLVSGRDQSSLVSLCQHLELPLIGCHGATLQAPFLSETWSAPLNQAKHQRLMQRCQEWCQSKEGLRLEAKSHSIAIHYRQRPQLEERVQHYLFHLGQQHPDYVLLTGKYVFELRHAAFNKATAIAQLMRSPPFEGKCPVMVGDDATDEAAFAWVNQHGGLSVHIGTLSTTCARYTLPTPQTLLSLLRNWERSTHP